MEKITPKALYIGPPTLANILSELRPDWQFLPSVDTIDAFFDGLNDQSISTDVQVLFVVDGFFDPTGANDTFEKLVAAMAPYCLFFVVNYFPEQRTNMDQKIHDEAYYLNVDISTLSVNYLPTTGTRAAIDAAVDAYVRENKVPEVAAILSGNMSEEERQGVLDSDMATNPEAAFASEDDSDEPNPYLGQVVAVTSSKGGSGKSTVAVTMATFLAHSSINSVREGMESRPLKVLIMDCDVRDGQLGFVTGTSSPNVVQLYNQGISKASIENTVISSPRLKVDLLLAPKRPKTVDEIPPEFYVELIHNLRKMYDYVILDTSVNYLDPLLEKVAYPTADQIIFVTDIVINSVFSMVRWIMEVTRPKSQNGMGINPQKIGIVVNKYLPDVHMDAKTIAKAAMGRQVIAVIPSSQRLVSKAANMQSMEILLRHKDTYSPIRKLCKAVVGRRYTLSDQVAE